jgi:hypothetical protein
VTPSGGLALLRLFTFGCCDLSWLHLRKEAVRKYTPPKLLHGVYTFTPKGGNKHETTKNQPSQLLVTENKLHDEEEADRDE